MVRTQSATTRQSFALPDMQAAAQRQLSSALNVLGKGDATRGVCLFAALILTLAGCLAPHIEAQTLATILFLAGACLAVLAVNTAFDGPCARVLPAPVRDEIPSTAPPAASHRPRPLPRTLAELVLAQDGPADGAHWHRLTQRMSHELRTPLNAVLGFSELMSAEVFGPLGAPQYQDYARSINCSGRSLLKSAEDALAITNLLTRPSHRARNPVASVRCGLDDMLAFHSPQAGAAGIRIETVFESDIDCDIAGEPQTLRQILINLMAEAMEHASPGSRLSVGSASSPDEVRITLVLDGPRASRAGRDDSFSLLLARTLLQLSQARLEDEACDGRWSATAIFPRAVQRDFFTCA